MDAEAYLDSLDDLSAAGVLRTLNCTVKPNHYIGFDTEDDTRGRVLACAFFDGQDFFYTTDPDQAITYILNYPEPSVFVAHNLEYDLANLFKHCDYRYIDEMRKAGWLLYASLRYSKHYFINSASFFSRSLAEMGEMIGLPKLEGDVFNPAYVKRDAEIVQVWMTRFQERINRVFAVNLHHTIGQLAMDIFRARYLKDRRLYTFNHPDCLRAYYGGRVEMYYKGLIKNVRVYDINSCYPYVMAERLYPDPEGMRRMPYDRARFGVGEFEVRVPEDTFLPPLPYRSAEGRLFFPVGRFRGWWTYDEVRRAESVGVKVLGHLNGWGTNASMQPFTGFVRDIYAMRRESNHRLDLDPQDNEARFDSELYKRIANNLYGKWGAHRAKTVMSRVRWTRKKQLARRVAVENVCGPFYQYTLDKDQPPGTANFIWGVYVTAYARSHLYDQLARAHASGNVLVYCDTDSVIIAGDAPVDFSVGDGLGALKEEHFDLGLFRQAKGYLLCNRLGDGRYGVVKAACKGVPQACAADFIVQGAADFRRPFRLREGLISQYAGSSKFAVEMGVNVWHPVSKEMRSIYIKRRGREGVLQPVNVRDIPVLEKNCFAASHSIQAELARLGVELALKDSCTSYFDNITVPADWGKNRVKINFTGNVRAGRLHFFSLPELEEVKPDEIWFTGQVMSLEKGKYGQFYKIRVTEHCGEVLTTGNFYAGLSCNLFPQLVKIKPENFIDKKIAIRLLDSYIFEEPVNLQVEIL